MANGTDRVYLDCNASAPLRAQARAAMLAALDAAGNASSVHASGRGARATIEAARAGVAALAGVRPRGVTFTSGGSEANATVLVPEWFLHGKPLNFDRLLVSAAEHPSVLKGGRFAPDRVETVPVDGNGVVDLAILQQRLGAMRAEGERVLVSIMAANNETGVLQPLREASTVVRAHGGMLVADAVQVFGKVPFDVAACGADAVTVSAHKIGGPQGAGAVIRPDDSVSFRPLVTGGGQELYARGGTENVAAIAGFGAAAAEAQRALETGGGGITLRTAVEAAVRAAAPDAVVFGEHVARLPNTVSFAVPGLSAGTLVIGFDLAGIAVSSGSACSSGKVTQSHVLAAMGVEPALARGAVRVSLGPMNTMQDVERFGLAWQSLCKRMRRAAA